MSYRRDQQTASLVADARRALKLLGTGLSVREAAKVMSTSHTRLYRGLNHIKWGDSEIPIDPLLE